MLLLPLTFHGFRRTVLPGENALPDGKQWRGFTLLELLAVIAIIAVLCGLVIGGGRRANESAKSAQARAELAALAVALEEYQRICGDYPQTDDSARLLQSFIGRRGPRHALIAIHSLIDLTKFSTEPADDPRENPSVALIDPWGRVYRYAYKTQSPWDNSSYVLYSIGPDGRDSAALAAGGFSDPAPRENADNLYAGHR